AGFREIWPAVLGQLADTPIGAYLAEAHPVAYEANAVTLAFAESNGMFQRHADRPQNRDALKAAIRTVTGKALQIRLEIREDDELDIDDELAALSEDELIDRVVAEFDATPIDEGDEP
ncbi:MAG: hypothetical protein QOF76_1219, partial [Solirubrobacteraceae bacterium]|nr:hypothetical protein [Solirubrobacteraceae bacterium]